MDGKKQKNRYKEITEAREILQLPEQATMREIKSKHKELVKKWHPDKNIDNVEECNKNIQKINDAYEIIFEYCNNYKFLFTQEEVKKYLSPEEKWYEQFGDDHIWGR